MNYSRRVQGRRHRGELSGIRWLELCCGYPRLAGPKGPAAQDEEFW
jgi:hypothetical protein